MPLKISIENLIKPCLKYDHPPVQENKVVQNIHIPNNGKPSINISILISQHNPPTKQLHRRKTAKTKLSYHILSYIV